MTLISRIGQDHSISDLHLDGKGGGRPTSGRLRFSSFLRFKPGIVQKTDEVDQTARAMERNQGMIWRPARVDCVVGLIECGIQTPDVIIDN